MSFIQRLVRRLVSAKLAAEIERESREWKLVCQHCRTETSYWDVGGIRWKAKSRGKRTLFRCPSCGTRTWAEVVHRTGEG